MPPHQQKRKRTKKQKQLPMAAAGMALGKTGAAVVPPVTRASETAAAATAQFWKSQMGETGPSRTADASHPTQRYDNEAGVVGEDGNDDGNATATASTLPPHIRKFLSDRGNQNLLRELTHLVKNKPELAFMAAGAPDYNEDSNAYDLLKPVRSLIEDVMEHTSSKYQAASDAAYLAAEKAAEESQKKKAPKTRKRNRPQPSPSSNNDNGDEAGESAGGDSEDKSRQSRPTSYQKNSFEYWVERVIEYKQKNGITGDCFIPYDYDGNQRLANWA